MSEELNQSESNPRVGFGKRLGAYLLDAVICSVLGALIGTLLGATLVGLFFGSQGGAAAGGIGALFGGIIGSIAGIFLMYIVLFLIEGITGQSFGKMILKIKVKNADGTEATKGTTFIRALLKYSNFILTLLAGITGVAILGQIGGVFGLIIFIGCFFVLGSKKQAIHDLLAKSAIFDK